MPMPTAFCSTKSTLVMTKKIKSFLPPFLSDEKSASKPIELKNASIKGSFSEPSKLSFISPKTRKSKNKLAAMMPPTTASGILYLLSTFMREFKKAPSKSTKTITTKVE